MQLNSYSETIDWLFAQFPSYQHMGSSAYKPGLENVEKLCEVIGNPQNKLKFVHLAGSNGKGSTASMISSYLTENKMKAGLFTSPHILDFRERIRVNGEMIGESEVIYFCNQIKELELDFEPSFFEISFTMALSHFEKKKCDICIIETGLGGRLDATNIITPLVSAITTISLEHTNFLGNTLEEVASEKAGIIKADVPVIIGRIVPKAKQVILKKAKASHSEWKEVDLENIDNPIDFPLLGDYQLTNYRTAVLIGRALMDKFSLDESLWAASLTNLTTNTGFQGRMQIVSESPRVIFDVSHNVEGIEKTLAYFENMEKKGQLFIVYGSSSDKNFEEIFPLFPKNAHYFLTKFQNNRSAEKNILKSHAVRNNLSFELYGSAVEALSVAKEQAAVEDTVLVFGSFFLLHDFF